MFVGLKYHIVRAADGFHMVSKSTARLGWVYSDLRTYTAEDWNQQQGLLYDITNSDNQSLKEEVARSTFGNHIDQAWGTMWDRYGSELP